MLTDDVLVLSNGAVEVQTEAPPQLLSQDPMCFVVSVI
jgi:hypothetical protein